MPQLLPGTATITLDITCGLTVIADLNTWWKLQFTGYVGALVYAVQAADTTITVTSITGKALGQLQAPTYYFNGTAQAQIPTVSIAIGSVITADGEEMYVSGISSPDPTTGQYILDVTRGNAQTLLDGTVTTFPNATPVDHPSGGQVAILKYVTPWDMIRQTLLIPGVRLIVAGLGDDSSMFSSAANGSVTLPSS